MAALFGSFWKAGSVAGLSPGAALATPGGPSWEAWAQPPAYTGKPSLYLNDITDPALELPAGTRLQIRLYGPEGDLSVAQTVADVPPPAEVDPKATPASAVPEAAKGVFDLTVTRSGNLSIEGPGGREWQVTALPDAAPTVEVSGDMTREADGRFKQSIKATDDYGITGAHVTIALELAGIDRRHGLKADPDAVDPAVLDIDPQIPFSVPLRMPIEMIVHPRDFHISRFRERAAVVFLDLLLELIQPDVRNQVLQPCDFSVGPVTEVPLDFYHRLSNRHDDVRNDERQMLSERRERLLRARPNTHAPPH